MATTVTMKELLEAGVHFGHQVRRWNPQMKEYIFGERNGISIIDLQKTQRMFRDALAYVTALTGEDRGRTILFVGTKRQAQDAIREEAERAGHYYINQRWLGGMLTNFQTVQRSISKLRDLEAMQTDGRYEKLTKKERITLDREREKLDKNLSGIRNMKRLPDALFVIDVRKEEIAIQEANRLGIPVIAVVDSNCSPNGVDYIIPGNDDALRAVRLFAARIADAAIEGQQMQSRENEDEQTFDAPPEVREAVSENVANVEAANAVMEQATNADGVDISKSADPAFDAAQSSIAGNQGFGKTGQQPDSIGDAPQAGTGAPQAGATAGGDDSSELQQTQNANASKGAEQVGAAS